ncbi:MAG: S8 family serine peptidase, partial [Solirubrobacterales bacterium]
MTIAVLGTNTATAATGAVAGELIVGFDDGVSGAESREIVGDLDASIEQRLRGHSAVVELEDGQIPTQAATALAAQDGVAYAEPNFLVRRNSYSNDQFLTDGTLWGLLKIKAPLAWGITRGDGVTVAVLDSGINVGHPDLVGNVWENPADSANGVDDDGNGFVDDVNGADWVRGDGSPDDEEGHGTHVAGTIAAAADDGNPSVGVARAASVRSL